VTVAERILERVAEERLAALRTTATVKVRPVL
jgi:hypothetical protein